jgi:hypothetical protein
LTGKINEKDATITQLREEAAEALKVKEGTDASREKVEGELSPFSPLSNCTWPQLLGTAAYQQLARRGAF